MCSLALSCNNYCHSRVSSCMQVPLRHTQPHVPSLQNEFMMGFACVSPLLLCAEARKLPCLQGCPTLLFQAQYPFVERGFCSFFWRSRDGGLPTNFSGHILFPSTKGRAVESQSWPARHLCQGSPDFSKTGALAPVQS